MSERAPASPVLQASIPAAYLWAVTLAPLVVSNAVILVRLLALTPLFAIGISLLWERRGGAYGLHALLWSTTITVSAALLAAPVRALNQFGVFRGALGIVGWLLFAYACAAPAIDAKRSLSGGTQVRRFRIFVMPLLALSLLGFGWDLADNERAVFVQVSACLLGLYLLTSLRFDGLLRIVLSTLAIAFAFATVLLLRSAHDVEGTATALGAVLSGMMGSRLERRSLRKAKSPKLRPAVP